MSEMLKWMRILGPTQRQILSDMCNGAQLIRCHDGVYRSCADVGGRSRLSIYSLDRKEVTRMVAVAQPIKVGYCDPEGENSDMPEDGYGFFYLPAHSRPEISECLTLTIKPPREAFFGKNPPQRSTESTVDLTVGLGEPVDHQRMAG